MQRPLTLPLQAAQHGMLLHETFHPHTTINFHPVAIDIQGKINISILKQALSAVIEKQPALTFVIRETQLVQTEFLQTDQWPLRVIDATSKKLDRPELNQFSQTLDSLNASDFLQTSFNLRQGPLWRSILIKFSEDHYQFCVLFHHIIIDACSVNIFFNDLSQYYNQLFSSDSELVQSIQPLEQTLLDSINDPIPEIQKQRKEYWKSTLADFNQLSLQTDYSAKTIQNNNAGERLQIHFPQLLCSQLQSFINTEKITAHTLFLTAWYCLLARYTHETDICIGITSANRMHPSLPNETMNQLMNCFINSIPIRLNPNSTQSFRSLLILVKQTVKIALQNQLPLNTILDSLPTTGTPSLFSTLLVFNKQKSTLQLAGTQASLPIEPDLGRCKFPYFGINIDETTHGFSGFIEYNTTLFSRETMIRLVDYYQRILDYISHHPECDNLYEIPLMSTADVTLQNQANNPFPLQKDSFNFVPHYFHEKAIQNPDKKAITYHAPEGNTETLTYQMLDQQSSQLANYLITKNIQKGSRIGICLTRSNQLWVAILAVLKVGAAIVPLENKESALDAIKYKITTTNLHYILTDQNTENLLLKQTEIASTISTINLSKLSAYATLTNTTCPLPNLDGTETAYIMLTSGTSGSSPKAIEVSHRSFANLLPALEEHLLKNPNLMADLRIICTAQPTFDAMLYDFVIGVISAGELHLVYEEGRFNPQVLTQIIQQYQINYAVLLPDILTQLEPDILQGYLISMGATLHNDFLQRLLRNPNLQLINGYGVTEATICNFLHFYDRMHPNQEDATLIGKPIPNIQGLILHPSSHHDANTLYTCPINVAGKLYLSGEGIAKGYLGQPELTQQKFFYVYYDQELHCYHRCESTHPNSRRLYDTGDWGCYKIGDDQQLSVQFLGRRDRQLKLRGVRIQPDMIENILNEHPFIEKSVILLNQNALWAYIIPKNLLPCPTQTELFNYLKAHAIPPTACPTVIITMTHFPLTVNGKINNRELLAYKPQVKQPELLHVETPTQTALLNIWSKVLSCPRHEIDIENSTFEMLGGDSFKYVTMIDEIRHHPSLKCAHLSNWEIQQYLSAKTTITKLEKLIDHYEPISHKKRNQNTGLFRLLKLTTPDRPGENIVMNDELREMSNASFTTEELNLHKFAAYTPKESAHEPIFLFPGILGIGDEMIFLAKALQSHYPEAPILIFYDSRHALHSSAKSYFDQIPMILEQMQRIIPNNFPRKLIGFSYGCAIVANLEKFLNDQKTPSLSYLIDGPNPQLSSTYFSKKTKQLTSDLINIVNYAAYTAKIEPLSTEQIFEKDFFSNLSQLDYLEQLDALAEKLKSVYTIHSLDKINCYKNTLEQDFLEYVRSEFNALNDDDCKKLKSSHLLLALLDHPEHHCSSIENLQNSFELLYKIALAIRETNLNRLLPLFDKHIKMIKTDLVCLSQQRPFSLNSDLTKIGFFIRPETANKYGDAAGGWANYSVTTSINALYDLIQLEKIGHTDLLNHDYAPMLAKKIVDFFNQNNFHPYNYFIEYTNAILFTALSPYIPEELHAKFNKQFSILLQTYVLGTPIIPAPSSQTQTKYMDNDNDKSAATTDNNDKKMVDSDSKNKINKLRSLRQSSSPTITFFSDNRRPDNRSKRAKKLHNSTNDDSAAISLSTTAITLTT